MLAAGRSWWLVAPGDFRLLVAGAGSWWLLLVAPGFFCWLLEASGGSWLVAAGVGWWLVACCGGILFSFLTELTVIF